MSFEIFNKTYKSSLFILQEIIFFYISIFFFLIFYINLIIFLIHYSSMSHNVLGIRRLGQVIGQCVVLTPAPNVVKQNATKGWKPDWRFAEPEPPNRRRSVYRLLCDVGRLIYLIFYSSFFVFIQKNNIFSHYFIILTTIFYNHFLYWYFKMIVILFYNYFPIFCSRHNSNISYNFFYIFDL